MKKTNYLYLSVFIAFVILSIISIFNGFDAKTIIVYSLSSFLFSIIDLLNTYLDGYKKAHDNQANAIDTIFGEFEEIVNEESIATLNNLQNGLNQTEKAKKELLNKILENSFDLKSAHNQALNKPNKNIIKTRKQQAEIGFNLFDRIIKSFENFKPDNKLTIIDIINLCLFMTTFIIIMIIPFMPNKIFSPLKSIITEIGISVTLLSLAIVFLTNFIRNFYHEKFEKMQSDSYYQIFNFIKHMKGMLEIREVEVQQKLEEYKKSISEVGNLMVAGLEKEKSNNS